jgi:hypothetical protein
MKLLNRIYFLLLALTLCISSTTAFSQYESMNPLEITTYIGNKPPLGTVSITSLFSKLYDVTLWSKSPQWSWQTPFALRLTYAQSFTSTEIVDASIDQMDKIHKLDNNTANHYRNILTAIFPGVKKNDAISAIYVPNKALLFFYNGHRIGKITDMRLARQFLDIWLSDPSKIP